MNCELNLSAKIYKVLNMAKKNLQSFDEIKQRLLQYAEYKDIAMGEFYEKISMYPSNFAGKGGESSLKSDNIVKVLNVFSDINPDWLLLGKGEMLRQNVSKSDVLSADQEAFYKNFIADKEKRIDELTRENEHLRIENEQMKASSGNTGIVVQHDGGGNHYSINNDLQQLAASQQKAILNLTEQNRVLTNIIANKL